MCMNTSLSIFARALASENLSFSFDPKAETASFDVKTRHLVMPVWNVSETLQTMLIAHEISHALWTPQVRSDELFGQAVAEGYNEKLLHLICNMVEDARIEKLMKQKYPGTRRDFFLGYKEIIDRDLFGLAGAKFDEMNIVNRMNIHFKWGVPGFLDLNLSAEEQAIAKQIDDCVTFDDAFAVAKSLYEHPGMEKVREKFENDATMDGKSKGEPDGDPEDGEANDPGKTGILDVSGDLKKQNGEFFLANSVTISPCENYLDQIIPTTAILAAYDKRTNFPDDDYRRQNPVNMTGYREFVKESDSFVRQLVAQFERRKAADEIRKERPKQTGMLNLDRLHQYRTHDDIFLSKIIKPDGKNHGIVFMLDLSGSMGQVIGDCFLQVLQLVWFCEKAKIPFEVFGFTNGGWIDEEQQEKAEYDAWRKSGSTENFVYSKQPRIANQKVNSVHYHDGKLYTLASSRDSAADRERLLAYLYESYVTRTRNRVIALSGTPTVECVSLATQFMSKWITDNNIQIPTIMVVTDGEPSGIYVGGDQHLPYNVVKDQVLTVTNEILGTMHRVDTAESANQNMSNVLIGTMLDGLKEKFNARRVGMYVGPNNLNEHTFSHFCVTQEEWVAVSDYRYTVYNTMEHSERFKAAKEAYKEGALLLPINRYPGYDAYFLIRTPKIVNDSDAIADSGTFTKIKNTFVKTMGKKAGSRVFLTRYVDIVAGQPIRGQDDSIYRLPFFKAP